MIKYAVQMDVLDSIDLKNDSTICLIQEALTRGFETWYYTPDKLYLHDGEVFALAQQMSYVGSKFQLAEQQQINLADIDVILMRQNPPLDMHYITSTYLLEKIHPKTLVINNPTEVRNLPEKLFICNYPDLMPPTVITKDIAIAENFLQKQQEIVIKPLYEFGGRDVTHVKFDKNHIKEFKQLFAKLLAQYSTAVMLQKFLPEVKKGDKRIFLVNGKIAGAINRVPLEGDIRANMVVGGVAEKTTLSSKETEACALIGDELKRRGIIIAGVDMIDGYITEVNVTSPTGIKAINDLYGLQNQDRIEAQIWESILAQLS